MSLTRSAAQNAATPNPDNTGPLSDHSPVPPEPAPLIPTPVYHGATSRGRGVSHTTNGIPAPLVPDPATRGDEPDSLEGISAGYGPLSPRGDQRLHGAQLGGDTHSSRPGNIIMDNTDSTSDTASLPGYGQTRWHPTEGLENRIEDTISRSIRDLAITLKSGSQKTGTIPVFSGEDWECPGKFLREIIKYCTNNGINRDEWASVVGGQIRGKAFQWFEPYRDMTLPLPELQSRLLATYDGPRARGKLLAKLYGQRQGSEAVALFLTQKRALLRRLLPDTDEATMIAQLETLIRPEIRVHLRRTTGCP